MTIADDYKLLAVHYHPSSGSFSRPPPPVPTKSGALCPRAVADVRLAAQIQANVRLEQTNIRLEQTNKKLKEDLEKALDTRGDKWRKSRITTQNARILDQEKQIALLRSTLASPRGVPRVLAAFAAHVALLKSKSNMVEFDYRGMTYLRDTDNNKIYDLDDGELVGNAEYCEVEGEFIVQFIPDGSDDDSDDDSDDSDDSDDDSE